MSTNLLINLELRNFFHFIIKNLFVFESLLLETFNELLDVTLIDCRK